MGGGGVGGLIVRRALPSTGTIMVDPATPGVDIVGGGGGSPPNDDYDYDLPV